LCYAGRQWLRKYRRALAVWEQRAAAHEDAELARLAGQPEWGSMNVPAGRTDVFGGTLAGWEALLAVHGASLLAQRPLLVIDLTGQDPARLLTALAQRAGTAIRPKPQRAPPPGETEPTAMTAPRSP